MKQTRLVAPRLLAVRCVAGVVDHGKSLSRCLPDVLRDAADERQHAFIQELSYGVLRWYPRLDALAALLLQRPIRSKDRDLHLLILVGLYQLGYLQLAEHAAINETVECARRLGKVWAVKLINGVLRGYQRKQAALEAQLDEQVESRTAHPGWLLAHLQSDWPDHWEAVTVANNSRPPMTLRVNCRHKNRDQYQQALSSNNIQSEAVAHTSHGLKLHRGVSVEQLPGFEQGWVSVQDSAAQLAQGLLAAEPGMRVLDACAAPGGKTAHILESTADLSNLTAVDIDAGRLERVDENLARLGLQGQLIAADVGDPETWWDGQAFDRILLDAPCSASGVIRRHPDIKILRREDDLIELRRHQLRLLRALWPLLAPRGMLLYATCSIFRQENSEPVGEFLASSPDAGERVINATWGHRLEVGRQVLPGENDMDGFYYACLVKEQGEKTNQD